MNPWQLAGTSESSQQIALFCFAAKACKYGFTIAKSQDAYKPLNEFFKAAPVEELKWLFHIPNGGKRGDTQRSATIAGGLLKAEGVKAGVHDIMWPLHRVSMEGKGQSYHGLFIEMKAPRIKTKSNPQSGCSPEQIEFGNFAHNQGFAVHVCYDWLEAAHILEWYYTL